MARLYTWMRTKRIALAFCALALLGAAGVWALQERQQPAGGPSALPAAGAAAANGNPFSWPYEIQEHSSMPRDLSFAEAKAEVEWMGEEVDMVGTAGAWAEISTPGTLLDVPLDVFEGPPPDEITVAYDFAIYFGTYGAAFERVSGVTYYLVFVGEFWAAYAPPLGPEIVQWGDELAPHPDLSAALAQAFTEMGEGGGVYVMPSAMLRVEDPYVSTWQPTPIDTYRAGGNFLYEFKVVPNQDPVAVVSADPTVGDAPLTVAFDGRGSSDPDGTIVNYAWTFGDGATASGTQAQVSHTYNAPDTYTATLTVTDDKGATDSASLTIKVIAVDRLVVKPDAATLLSGEKQQFKAEGTWYGPDGTPDTADDETYDVTSLASWRVEPREPGEQAPGTITDAGLFTAVEPAGDEGRLRGYVYASLDTELEASAEVLVVKKPEPVLDIDVARLDGKWVPERYEDTQGTITKVQDPTEDVYPAMSWALPLRFKISPLADTFVFEADQMGSSEGVLSLINTNGGVPTEIWRSDQGAITLQSLSGSYYLTSVRGGVNDLVFSAYKGTTLLGTDVIRVSAIPVPPASGRIIYVNPGAAARSAPYDDFKYRAAATVSEAAKVAKSRDNIVIARARYADHDIRIRPGIVAAGLTGKWTAQGEFDYGDAPLIDAQQKGRHMFLASGADTKGTTIGGLQLVNGWASSGGSVLVLDNRRVLIQYSYFKNNVAGGDLAPGTPLAGAPPQPKGTGGSILVDNADAVLVGNVLDGNQAIGQGGHVYFRGDPMGGKNRAGVIAGLKGLPNELWVTGAFKQRSRHKVIVRGNTFVKGRAKGNGGAISVGEKGKSGVLCVFRGANNFIDCKAFRGGAVHIRGVLSAGSIIQGATFTDCRAVKWWGDFGDGGAIAVQEFAGVTIRDNKFLSSNPKDATKGCSAEDDGGAMYFTLFSVAIVYGNTISYAHADGGVGGAVAISMGSTVRMADNVYGSCRADAPVTITDGHGGAVCIRDSRVEMQREKVTKCRANGAGGAICVYSLRTEEQTYPDEDVMPVIVALRGCILGPDNITLRHGGGAVGCIRAYGKVKPRKLLKIDILECSGKKRTKIDRNKALKVLPGVGTRVVGGVFYKDVGEFPGYMHMDKAGAFSTALWNADMLARSKILKQAPVPLRKPILASLEALFYHGIKKSEFVKDYLLDTDLTGNAGYHYAFKEPIRKGQFVEKRTTMGPHKRVVPPTIKP